MSDSRLDPTLILVGFGSTMTINGNIPGKYTSYSCIYCIRNCNTSWFLLELLDLERLIEGYPNLTKLQRRLDPALIR